MQINKKIATLIFPSFLSLKKPIYNKKYLGIFFRVTVFNLCVSSQFIL